MIKKILILILVLTTLSACTRSAKVYEPTLLPTIEPSVQPTALPSTQAAAEFPTPTIMVMESTLAPTSAPTQKPTLKPYEPFSVYSAVDGLYLRTGPGTFFMATTMVFPSDPLTTNFVTMGGEWLNVTTVSGESGFVFIKLLAEDDNIDSVPRKMPDYVGVVKGLVTDSQGTPIQGVGISFSQEGTDLIINSDKNGEFYFYHNPDDVGQWTLTYAAIACESNVWVGSDCAQMKPEYTGQVEPASLIISLPYTGEPIKFIWK